MIIVFGMAFRTPGPLSKHLSSELSWDMLPKFATVAYGPEVLDAFLITIYLRRVGVDWLGLCKDMMKDRCFVFAKVICLFYVLLLLLLAGIDSQ